MTTTQQLLPTLAWVVSYTGLCSCWVDDYEVCNGRLIVRLSENFSEVNEYEVEFMVRRTSDRIIFELPTSFTEDGKADFENLCDICGFTNEVKPFLRQNL